MTLCSWDTTLASLENVSSWNGSYESQQTLKKPHSHSAFTRIFIVCAVESTVSLYSHSILLYCNSRISLHSSTELRVLKSFWGWGNNFSMLKFRTGHVVNMAEQQAPPSPKAKSQTFIREKAVVPWPRSLYVGSSLICSRMSFLFPLCHVLGKVRRFVNTFQRFSFFTSPKRI